MTSPLSFLCFSSAYSQDPAANIENLLDQLCVALTGGELDIVQKVYRLAMKLEIQFFLSQQLNQPCIVPFSRLHDPKNQLFLYADFNLTCTVVDSSAVLAEVSIINVPKFTYLGGDRDDNDDSPVKTITSSEIKDSWLAISEQYVQELEQCISSLLPPEEGNC